MKEYFIILVNVTFFMKTQDWVGTVDGEDEFETYPTTEQIEIAIRNYVDKDYSADERARVHYARVEKRYRLRRD